MQVNQYSIRFIEKDLHILCGCIIIKLTNDSLQAIE